MGEREDFREFRGDEQYGLTRAGQPPDERIDLRLGADIDTAGRFIENQNRWSVKEGAGEQNLLLVTATEFTNGLLGAAGFDGEIRRRGLRGAPFGGGVKEGASAELVAMVTIGAADMYGLPVSTTQVLSSGVAGTMAASRSGLQWATVRNLAMAWVLTLPSAMLLSGGLYRLFVQIF